MANFTPQEIEEMLREFFNTVGKRQYIGARYVPIFGRKGEDSIIWDNSAPYEPLTIVLYQGNSYTSRQYVPTGIDILDESFWANTGNYNAQIEQYKQETLQAIDDLSDSLDLTNQAIETEAENRADGDTALDGKITQLKDYVDSTQVFGFIKTLENCGLFASPKYFDNATEYVEDVTYKPEANAYYIATSTGNIILADSNFNLVSKKNVVASAISTITYNTSLDLIYASTQNKVLIIQPLTIEVIDEITVDKKICYDTKNDVIFGYSLSSGVFSWCTYDTEFNVLDASSFTIDNITATQGACLYDNVLITANFNYIIEIDYVKEVYKLIKLSGQYEGALEIEGFCYNDDIIILSQIWDYSIPTDFYNIRIFKNNLLSQDNINTIYSNNISNRLRGGISLNVANFDLNDAIASGNYYAGDSAIVQTFVNCPARQAFVMKVYNAYGTGSSKIQELQTNGEDFTHIYKRRYVGGSFSEWKLVSFDVNNTIPNFKAKPVSLLANQTLEYTFTNNMCVVITGRNGACIFVCNYWDASVAVIGTDTNRITITKNANSRALTIVNNIDGQTPILILE